MRSKARWLLQTLLSSKTKCNTSSNSLPMNTKAHRNKQQMIDHMLTHPQLRFKLRLLKPRVKSAVMTRSLWLIQRFKSLGLESHMDFGTDICNSRKVLCNSRSNLCRHLAHRSTRPTVDHNRHMARNCSPSSSMVVTRAGGKA